MWLHQRIETHCGFAGKARHARAVRSKKKSRNIRWERPRRRRYVLLMNVEVCPLPCNAAVENAHDYRRIERAIAFLHECHLEQPELADVARHVHLSEFHFQRLFSRWAGISPKRFVQFLTVEHAKQQLAASKALLDASLDSGLSGPGRLHDLFVTLEAVTPGEFKSRGAGVNIGYAFHPTPFGECLIGTTGRGICWLSFLHGESRAGSVNALREKWSGANLRQG